jgi:UDP-N-acetylglucosamine 2-epimerase (non-hydrolysing)
MIVFGTRPEAIKMASLVKKFQKHGDKFDVKVCITAQHREMLDQVLEFFEITPHFDLNIMKPNQDLFDITSNIMNGLRNVFSDFRPDYILVHGDTTTTLAASIAAYYMKIGVLHIEAGLRTGDIYSTWPEEANRRLTTQLAAYHFAPTELSRKNLIAENIPETNIVVTGNTVIDTLFYALETIKKKPELERKILAGIKLHTEIDEKRIILVTGHRRENFGEKFTNIFHALKKIAEKHDDVVIIYPVHLNPNVKKPAFDILSGVNNICLIEPLPYIDFIYLMSLSHLIITDSGGIQEEAPSLGKPVLVTRETTERPEASEAGVVRIIGTNTDNIIDICDELLDHKESYDKMSKASNPYGDGKSAQRIVSFLREVLDEKK